MVASMTSIFVIDLFFMIPGLVNLGCLVLIFLFCNWTIINAKKLDLRMKDPVFSTVNETISGLIQIRIFKRRGSLLKEFTDIANTSFRASINYWFITRVFGVYSHYITAIIMTIGFALGIRNIETN